MEILNTIFTFYDHLIAGLPTELQFFVSLAMLALIVSTLLLAIKHGHWIFILLFVILFPSTWSVLRNLGLIIWLIIKFLLVRMTINV